MLHSDRDDCSIIVLCQLLVTPVEDCFMLRIFAYAERKKYTPNRSNCDLRFKENR